MQKDYKFHYEIVEILLDTKYDVLQDIDLATITETEIDLILNLKDSLKKSFWDRTYLVNGVPNSNNTGTDTLISKIMLGTLCCSPAYDRFFRDGLDIKGIPNKSFNKKAFLSQKEYFNNNLNEFLDTQKKINQLAGFKYPTMKVFDMYLWELGYEKSLK
jgi:hypothetical protein